MSSRPPGSGAVAGLPGIFLDQAKFPSLPTQKALLLIDFQNDFVSKDGALPITSADDALVERAAKLAAGFRDVGIVIWVQSQFEKPRRFLEGHQIITSASQPPTSGAKGEKPPLDPEAFLSAKSPTCVKRGTQGWQLAPPLKKIVDPKRDIVLMKTHYSAFEATRLIQMLRSKLVTSLYICGSLINIGVHATAVDAAAHGYAITLVRDCCGRSSQARADSAIANLTDVSGCAVVRARSIVPAIGAEEDGAGNAVIREADTLTIEPDDADDLEDAEEVFNESGMEVLKELKKKYARSRVTTPKQRVANAGAGEEGSRKAGEKKAGDRAQWERRGPTRQRSERSTSEQKPADKTKGLEEGMGKLSLSPESKKGDSSAPKDRPASKSADKTKEPGERWGKTVPSNVEKPAPRSDQSAKKPANKTEEAVEQSDKTTPSKVEKRGPARDQSTEKQTDDAKELQEGLDKLSLSSDKKITSPRARTAKKPTEETSELQKSLDKLSLSESKDSALSANRSVADHELKSSRGGAPASPVLPSQSTAHGSKSGEGSGSTSKAREKDEKLKSALPEASCPNAPGDKVSEPSGTKETPPTPAPKPPNKTMSTKTAPAPAATAGSPPSDKRSPKESEPLCEGDTKVIYDVLPPSLEPDAFAKLKDEVDWQRMSHLGGEVPRLVAVQGTVGADGSHPVYRHPSDESPPLLPFSPTVDALRKEVEKRLGHELNHVLIQFYRDGKDYISEHSDKTLDIVPGSYIANLSLGAERTMVFRTKRPEKEPSWASPETGDKKDGAPEDTKAAGTPTQRETQRARLPHNSLLRMGLKTNAIWLHSIRQDKRLPSEKTPAELSFSGARISLTFRHIGTFLDEKEEHIWGQGAKGKDEANKGKVVNGDEEEGERMVRTFGVENRMGRGFEWGRWYGEGFDVLHMRRS